MHRWLKQRMDTESIFRRHELKSNFVTRFGQATLVMVKFMYD